MLHRAAACVADMKGKAAVHHIWCAILMQDPGWHRQLLLGRLDWRWEMSKRVPHSRLSRIVLKSASELPLADFGSLHICAA